MNHLLDEADDSSCIEKSQIEVHAKLQHFHTYGCPMYALTPEAENAKTKKWDARSRVDLCLEPSPMHAESVSLFLSLETGLTSPRFSVVHND